MSCWHRWREQHSHWGVTRFVCGACCLTCRLHRYQRNR